MKESESRRKGLIAQKEVKSVVEKREIPVPPPLPEVKTDDIPLPSILQERINTADLAGKINVAPTSSIWDIPLRIVEDPVVEVVEVVEEEMILPAEAVEIIADFAHSEPIFDASLKIELLTEVGFKGGERGRLR